jgi:hypothetical protein
LGTPGDNAESNRSAIVLKVKSETRESGLLQESFDDPPTLQNTNAYEVGFTPVWDGLRGAYWKNRTPETEKPLEAPRTIAMTAR